MQKLFNNLKNKGQISRTLLIGAGAVLIIIIIVFAVIFFTRNNKTEQAKKDSETPTIPEPPKPVYEKQIGNIYFILESSEDLGSVLKAKTQSQRDLITTEKFIRVVVAAQNKGKTSTPSYGWDIGSIIDSEGRIFDPINAFYFLPNPNPCGISLKPEFYPIACTKIYEVSKISEGLKIQISAKDQKDKELLDLKF